jgi:hypothetical protein
VACPWEAVTQPVGCPLSVSPAGAVLFGGLSSWLRLLVPNRWLGRQAHNRKLPDEREEALKPRSRNRKPLDERERAPNPLRTSHQPVMPEHAAVPIVIQSFCITPIQAFLTIFRVCQGIFPALTNPKNR